MMTAISDKIRSVDQVFVVGHKNLDMDALGSAVGMQLFASNVTENSYALYDEEQMSPDIERAVSFLEKEGVTKLLSVKDAWDGNQSFFVDSCRPFKDSFNFIERIL